MSSQRSQGFCFSTCVCGRGGACRNKCNYFLRIEHVSLKTMYFLYFFNVHIHIVLSSRVAFTATRCEGPCAKFFFSQRGNRHMAPTHPISYSHTTTRTPTLHLLTHFTHYDPLHQSPGSLIIPFICYISKWRLGNNLIPLTSYFAAHRCLFKKIFLDVGQ